MNRPNLSFTITLLTIAVGILLFSCSDFDSAEQNNKASNASDNKEESAVELPVHVVIPDTLVNKDDGSLTLNAEGVLVFREKPFSGHAVTYYPNGQIENNLSYYNGLQEDTSYSFYEDGTLRYIRPFRKGNKHGEHIGWWPNKQMKYKYYFENGQSEGNHLTWFRDGSVFRDQNYKNGHEFGRQQIYRSDGKIRSNYIIRENGRKYGLVGLKRCDVVDTDSQQVKW